MPPIIKQLTAKLSEERRGDVKQALLDYALDLDLDATDLIPDHELVEDLLPSLYKANSSWKGLKGNIEWKGSTAHKHVVDTLKNQLREKGKYFARKLEEARKDRDATDSELDEADERVTDQAPPSKLVGKKRSHQPEGEADQDTTPAPTPVKQQKTAGQDHLIQTPGQAAEPRVQPTSEAVAAASMEQAFAELRRVALLIRARRGEISELTDKWKALHA